MLLPSVDAPTDHGKSATAEQETDYSLASEQNSQSSPGHSSSESTRRHSHSRPTLAHRIHTQNLRVQANAKNLRARLLSGPLVDFYVGKARRHWSLHRNLLCHHSQYLSNEFLPSHEHQNRDLKIELPEDDPAGFELLVRWLYQGKLDDVSQLPDPFEKYDYAVACHKLWLLCDRFDMPQLKNLAIDQYRKGLHEAELVPDAGEINDIYRATNPGSPFRRLVTKIAARQIMDPHTEKDASSYKACFVDNADFAVELVNVIKNDSGGMLFEDPTEKADACTYHDHEDGPNCHTKGKSGVSISTSSEGRGAFQSKFRKPLTPPVSPPESTSPTREPSDEAYGDDASKARMDRSPPQDIEILSAIEDDNASDRDGVSPAISPERSHERGEAEAALLTSENPIDGTRRRTLAPPKLARRVANKEPAETKQ